MGVNRKCPKCGSNHVMMVSDKSKHGCLWTILFGIYYIAWLLCKWCVGLMVFLCYDWWMFAIKKIQKKGHVWQCRKWFAMSKQVYYCHDCGYQFKA